MRVLFVCTGNTGRSLMAERIFNHMIKGQTCKAEGTIEAISAGVSANEGEPPEEHAVEALQEIGITVDNHRAKQVTPELLDSVGLILTMSRHHKEQIMMMSNETNRDLLGRVYLLTEFVGDQGDIMDCYGHDLNLYHKCVERLHDLIERAIKRIEDSAQ